MFIPKKIISPLLLSVLLLACASGSVSGPKIKASQQTLSWLEGKKLVAIDDSRGWSGYWEMKKGGKVIAHSDISGEWYGDAILKEGKIIVSFKGGYIFEVTRTENYNIFNATYGRDNNATRTFEVK